MAQMDVVAGMNSLAAGGTVDLKPSSGVEWVINNVYFGAGGIKLCRTDGTLTLDFDIDPTAGFRANTLFRVTSTHWIQIKNTSAAAIVVAYDGVVTK